MSNSVHSKNAASRKKKRKLGAPQNEQGFLFFPPPYLFQFVLRNLSNTLCYLFPPNNSTRYGKMNGKNKEDKNNLEIKKKNLI